MHNLSGVQNTGQSADSEPGSFEVTPALTSTCKYVISVSEEDTKLAIYNMCMGKENHGGNHRARLTLVWDK